MVLFLFALVLDLGTHRFWLEILASIKNNKFLLVNLFGRIAAIKHFLVAISHVALALVFISIGGENLFQREMEQMLANRTVNCANLPDLGLLVKSD